MERTNRLLALLPPDALEGPDLELRQVDSLVVSPSQPLDEISARHIGDLPASVRFLLRPIGATSSGGATSANYLLFTHGFTSELIALGQRDTLWSAAEIEKMFAL